MQPLTPDTARALYPHIADGRIFFNHASISPISIPVRESIDNYLNHRMVTGIDDYKIVLDYMARAKKGLGGLLNCTPDRIAFIDNTTNAFNNLAQSLTWQPGDRVLINDVEFPANVYPFLNLRSKGVEIDIVKSKNGKILLEDLESAITSKTKLLSISFVQFLTGFRADLEAIGNLCKKHGIIFSVDAIQGVGALSLDVKRCNIDYLAGGTQKWLMGLMGLSYLYVTEELQTRMTPAYAGWLSVVDAWNLLDYNLTPLPTADAFQTGTVTVIGAVATGTAIDIFNSVGIENIEQRIVANTAYFINELAEMGFPPLLFDAPLNELSGIVTVKHPNGEKLFNFLSERKVHLAFREGYLRFSPHYYNTVAEIDIVLSLIKEFE